MFSQIRGKTDASKQKETEKEVKKIFEKFTKILCKQINGQKCNIHERTHAEMVMLKQQTEKRERERERYIEVQISKNRNLNQNIHYDNKRVTAVTAAQAAAPTDFGRNTCQIVEFN